VVRIVPRGPPEWERIEYEQTRGSPMDVDHEDGWIAVDTAVQPTAPTDGVIETQQ
jgi:hypothetical protein